VESSLESGITVSESLNCARKSGGAIGPTAPVVSARATRHANASKAAGTHARSTEVVVGIAARISDWPKTRSPRRLPDTGPDGAQYDTLLPLRVNMAQVIW